MKIHSELVCFLKFLNRSKFFLFFIFYKKKQIVVSYHDLAKKKTYKSINKSNGDKLNSRNLLKFHFERCEPLNPMALY